jgi:hypothetical protein
MYMRIAWSTVSRCARNEVQRGVLPAHDPHREHPHPPRSKFTGVSFAINEFGGYCGDELGLRLELGGELVEQEKDIMGVSEWGR